MNEVKQCFRPYKDSDGIFTFHISSSVYCPVGSMLLLTVPSKRTGS